MHVEPLFWEDYMHFEDSHRITVSEDCREIVRLVHSFHKDGKVRLSTVEYSAEPLETLQTHRRHTCR